jgi:hypothetical protein
MENDEFRMSNGGSGSGRQVLFIRHYPFVIRHFFSVRLRDRAEIRPGTAAQSFAPSADGSGRSPEKQTARAADRDAAGATEGGFSAFGGCPGAAQR